MNCRIHSPRPFALLALIFTLAVSFGASAAHALRPVERHQWCVGLAYGVGRATVDWQGRPAGSEWNEGAAPQYRFGRLLTPHFMLGIEHRQWLNEGGLAGYKVRGNAQNLSLVLTTFPGRTTDWTGGFFVKVGGGLAHGRVSALEPFSEPTEWGETYELVYKHDARGWAALAGIGYEFAVSKHVAAGVFVTYNLLRFDDDEVFDQVQFYPGGLNLNWYF